MKNRNNQSAEEGINKRNIETNTLDIETKLPYFIFLTWLSKIMSIFFININIFHHLKLEIALAILASNDENLKQPISSRRNK